MDRPRRCRCPKCRRNVTRFTGWGQISETMDVVRGRAQYYRSGDEFVPSYVIAECECGHKWRIRWASDVAGVADKLGLETDR